LEIKRRIIAATAPPKTRKSKIKKVILGLFFFSGTLFAAFAMPGAPGGGAIGLGIGGPPGVGAPIAGAPGRGEGPPGGGIAPPGPGKVGPPLGAVNDGLGPPLGTLGAGAPGLGSVGVGSEGEGDARAGTGPGAGMAGTALSVGNEGEGEGTGLTPGAGGRLGLGTVGAGDCGTLGAAGVGSGAAGAVGEGATGFAADGMGAGVPSVGLILGAKGERVTRNLGPPSPGLTGAPSLGVSLRVGLGGVGNPSSDIRLNIQEALTDRGNRKTIPWGCFFRLNRRFPPWKHLQWTYL